MNNHRKGDKVAHASFNFWCVHNLINASKICLFGFSRGAYTARALAGLLTKVSNNAFCLGRSTESHHVDWLTSQEQRATGAIWVSALQTYGCKRKKISCRIQTIIFETSWHRFCWRMVRASNLKLFNSVRNKHLGTRLLRLEPVSTRRLHVTLADLVVSSNYSQSAWATVSQNLAILIWNVYSFYRLQYIDKDLPSCTVSGWGEI